MGLGALYSRSETFQGCCVELTKPPDQRLKIGSGVFGCLMLEAEEFVNLGLSIPTNQRHAISAIIAMQEMIAAGALTVDVEFIPAGCPMLALDKVTGLEFGPIAATNTTTHP